MADINMAEARYVGPDGREQIVQLPGTALRGGNARYDAMIHKGRLHCLHCEARVNFDPGSETIAGGLKGPSPHFQRNAGAQHDAECLMPLRLNEGRDAREYDGGRGYRIHLNTRAYSALFNDAAYPYERDAQKKLIVKDPALKDMEPFSVKTIGDLMRIMRKGDFERLRQSVVIQKGAAPVPWAEFFIRYARSGPQTRFIDLVRNLQTRRNQPVLMEIFNDKSVWPKGLFDRKLYGESKPIAYREHGRQHMIVPRIWLDNTHDDYVRMALADPGRYLVLGHPRLKTVEQGGTIIHYLNLSVTDRRQIAAANVDELAQTARANNARRNPPSL